MAGDRRRRGRACRGGRRGRSCKFGGRATGGEADEESRWRSLVRERGRNRGSGGRGNDPSFRLEGPRRPAGNLPRQEGRDPLRQPRRAGASRRGGTARRRAHEAGGPGRARGRPHTRGRDTRRGEGQAAAGGGGGGGRGGLPARLRGAEARQLGDGLRQQDLRLALGRIFGAWAGMACTPRAT